MLGKRTHAQHDGKEQQPENSKRQRLFTPEPTQPPPTKQSPAISLDVIQNEIVPRLNFLGKVNAYAAFKGIPFETLQDRDGDGVQVIKDVRFAEKILVRMYEKHYAPKPKSGKQYFKQWIGEETRESTLDVSKPTLVSLRDGESFHQISERIKQLKLQHVGIVCARPYRDRQVAVLALPDQNFYSDKKRNQTLTVGETDGLLYKCDDLISVHFIMPYVTSVGDKWLDECKSLTHVTFAGMSSLARVGNDWMYRSSNLVNVDFHGLDLLKNVGAGWLDSCGGIIDIRFEGLQSLVEVGHRWMQECEHLQSVDFRGLNSLEKVGDDWLAVIYDTLISPKFVGLPKLKEVGMRWLAECYVLEHPNFEELHSLERNGEMWMIQHGNVHSCKPEFGERLSKCVDVEEYTDSEGTVWHYVMKECAVGGAPAIFPKLNFLSKVNAYAAFEGIPFETVQDRDGNEVQVIKDVRFAEEILVSRYEKHYAPKPKSGKQYFKQWVGEATHGSTLDVSKPTLVSLRNGESFQQISERIKQLKLQHVGIVCARPCYGNTHDLLSFCDNLISVHFIMPYVTSVGDQWLGICENLTQVTFAGMSSLAHMGDSWMAYNPKLVSVDFKGLDRLEKVGSKWLESCESIIYIRFEGLCALVEVGGLWMKNCTQLQNVNFRGLDSLERVGWSWLANASKLTSPQFVGLPKLRRVGRRWLENCVQLESPNFGQLRSLIQVEYGWMNYYSDTHIPSNNEPEFGERLSKCVKLKRDIRQIRTRWSYALNWKCALETRTDAMEEGDAQGAPL